jgi:ribonuclease D
MGKTISKEEIKELEPGKFEGKVIVADTEKIAVKALGKLNGTAVLGFDTETKPTFKKGVTHQVALIQLASDDLAVLIRIQKTGIFPELKALLEDEKIAKVGIATKQDLKELKESGDFEPKGFIDLNKEAPRYGYESVGVKNLSAMILGFRVSKRQQTSNWEAPQLTEAQIRYAATDAWVCREIYLRMKKQPISSN